MARDYSKIKALAQSILECIGDEPEGENPSLPKQEAPDSYEGLGVDDDGNVGLGSAADTEEPEEKKRKKRGDDVVALLSSTLASKFNK